MPPIKKVAKTEVVNLTDDDDNIPSTSANARKRKAETQSEKQFDEKHFPVSFDDFWIYTNISDVVFEECKRKRTDFEDYIKRGNTMKKAAHKMYIHFYGLSRLRKKTPLISIKAKDDCPVEIRNVIYNIPQIYEHKRKRHKKEHRKRHASDGKSLENPARNDAGTQGVKIIHLSLSVWEKLGLPMIALKDFHHYEKQFPIKFEQFKNLLCYEDLCETISKNVVNNDKLILKILRTCENWKEQVLRSIYVQYFKEPSIRKKYIIKFKPCPNSIREKLLKTAEFPVSNEESQINIMQPRDKQSENSLKATESHVEEEKHQDVMMEPIAKERKKNYVHIQSMIILPKPSSVTQENNLESQKELEGINENPVTSHHIKSSESNDKRIDIWTYIDMKRNEMLSGGNIQTNNKSDQMQSRSDLPTLMECLSLQTKSNPQ